LAAIQETIHAVLGTQPYTMVGYSYGGYLALGLAFQQPERVARLFLVCPTLTGIKGERHVAKHRVITTTPIDVTANADYFANYQKVTVVQTPQTWQAFQTQVIPGIRRTDLDALHQLHRDHGQHYRLTFEPDLKTTRFTQPITLLSGRHDVTIGYTDHLAFMARQVNGTLGLFADAGHNLPIDQYAMMAAYFRHFLTTFA
jgi:pimeloyl-ACP methyl ester carboxylesterase